MKKKTQKCKQLKLNLLKMRFYISFWKLKIKNKNQFNVLIFFFLLKITHSFAPIFVKSKFKDVIDLRENNFYLKIKSNTMNLNASLFIFIFFLFSKKIK